MGVGRGRTFESGIGFDGDDGSAGLFRPVSPAGASCVFAGNVVLVSAATCLAGVQYSADDSPTAHPFALYCIPRQHALFSVHPTEP
jgi:hypothetical protein